MLSIVNDIIKLTKGDTANIKVQLMFANGGPYELQNGDTLTLTVRKKPRAEILLQSVSSTTDITLDAESTARLSAGAMYYDIELKTAGGEIYTVVGVRENNAPNMIVLEEVTY